MGRRTCDCRNCRPRILRGGFRGVKRLYQIIPGSGLISTIVVVSLGWVLLRVLTPNYDIPYMPGVSCGQTSPERPGGVTGVAYRAGEAMRHLDDEAPKVAAVKAALSEIATDAGAIWANIEAGVKGLNPPPPLEHERQGQFVPTSDGCSPCPGSSSQGAELAARAALAAGWTGADAVMAVAIAGAESGWNPDAVNPTSSAKGMWQTMMSLHEPKYQGASWSDPMANARVAHQLWRERGWQPWTVYTSGAYKRHVDEARAAVRAVRAGESSAVTVASFGGWSAVAKELGIKPVAAQAVTHVRQTLGFDGTVHGYGTRGNETWHDDGLAVDFMVTGEEGDRIAEFFRSAEGREAFSVNNVIWKQRITNEGRGWEWGGMEDRGGVTANHYDHVHVDFHEVDGGACGGDPIPVTAKS